MEERKERTMIILCENSKEVDTARLSPEERHIIQKLLIWKSLVTSMAGFKKKTAAALRDGWNNSGPVCTTQDLALVITHFEKKVQNRLKNNGSGS